MSLRSRFPAPRDSVPAAAVTRPVTALPAPGPGAVDIEPDDRDIEAIRHYYRTDFVERELHDCSEGAAHLPHHL